MSAITGSNFWQGQRVRLRGLEPADAEHFLRWNRDSERACALDFLWPPQSEAAVSAWVAEQALKRLENDAYHWLIENRAGQAVGSINTHDCQPRHGTFSYALDIAAEHRRQGYASEAIGLVLRYYFHELRYQKANLKVFANNPASLALHERLGFVREGTLRRSLYQHGQYVDVVLFGMTREEFDGLLAE